MSLAGRDLVTISDLSNEEMEGIFGLADEMARHARGIVGLGAGKVMATLFYEASTRTRLSFESAMQRLGGGVITCADMGTTSVAKGETLADTVRVVESYADILVMRSPQEGAARVAADYARVPVINAGDGAHEHPTQTLLDLYTIRRESGRLQGCWVALVGDLKYGRTTHSLAVALARFGGSMVCVAPPGLEMPAEVLAAVEAHTGSRPRQYRNLEELTGDLDLLKAHSPQASQPKLAFGPMSLFDAIYVTRVQRERFTDPAQYEKAKGAYRITADLLANARSDTLVMHPLPRVDELDYGLDEDLRAAYFRQASYGIPVRMALLAALLGRAEVALGAGSRPPTAPRPVPGNGLACSNPRCVLRSEWYLSPRFELVGDEPVRCAYCQRLAEVPV